MDPCGERSESAREPASHDHNSTSVRECQGQIPGSCATRSAPGGSRLAAASAPTLPPPPGGLGLEAPGTMGERRRTGREAAATCSPGGAARRSRVGARRPAGISLALPRSPQRGRRGREGRRGEPTATTRPATGCQLISARQGEQGEALAAALLSRTTGAANRGDQGATRDSAAAKAASTFSARGGARKAAQRAATPRAGSRQAPTARRGAPGGTRRPRQGTRPGAERPKGDRTGSPQRPGELGQGTAWGLPTTERASAHTGGSFQAGGLARGPRRRARRPGATPRTERSEGAQVGARSGQKGPGERRRSGAARDEAAPGPGAHTLERREQSAAAAALATGSTGTGGPAPPGGGPGPRPCGQRT